MPPPKPTTAQIAALAEELGYEAIAAAPEEYTAMVTSMLGMYEAVETIAEPVVLSVRQPVDHRTPSVQEDPHHAWALRTSIPGAATGLLAGVRIGVKDSIMVAGLPMANGSDVLSDYRPVEDATVVTRVLEAGAEIVGKTTNEYFCMSGGSHTAHSGPVHNPHRMGTSAGGSSSGSAVALVTGEADMTLGADQAGSIRMPASWCGVVGLKPTYGLVPYTGVAPLDAVFDHVGPMTVRNLADNAKFLTVIAGTDGIDPRQGPVHVGDCDYLSTLDDDVRGLRIGVLSEGFAHPNAEAGVDQSVRAAAESLRELGARVEDVSVPLHRAGPALWTAIAVEGITETVLRNQGFGFGRYDHYPVDMMQHLLDRRNTVDGRPPNVALFTLIGRFIDSHQGRLNYAKAINRTRTLRAAYDQALERYDVLVMPTTPQTARPLPNPSDGPATWVQAATEMPANTCPFNITHHPALSVPCGNLNGLPIGVQLVGRHFDEAMLYRIGQALEQV